MIKDKVHNSLMNLDYKINLFTTTVAFIHARFKIFTR